MAPQDISMAFDYSGSPLTLNNGEYVALDVDLGQAFSSFQNVTLHAAGLTIPDGRSVGILWGATVLGCDFSTPTTIDATCNSAPHANTFFISSTEFLPTSSTRCHIPSGSMAVS